MQLNASDTKLLAYLYHDNREPITKIARACRLSREQVDYKIKKYVLSGLVKKFIPIFDYSKFCYNCFASLFLKFDKPSSIKIFSQKLKGSKNCISWGLVFGKYDLYINSIFKNEKELNDYISGLVGDPSNPVLDYLIIKPYFSELYPLKFFNQKNKEDFLMIGQDSMPRKFDKKDMEILKLLENDGRVRLKEIASKLNISNELAFYKLKKLRKDKVFLGSRIQFNMGKLGYFFALILLNVRNFSETNRNKIKQFVKNHQHTNSLIFSLMKPNCIIQVFCKDVPELKAVFNKINELFPNEHVDIDLLLIEGEEDINTLPFV